MHHVVQIILILHKTSHLPHSLNPAESLEGIPSSLELFPVYQADSQDTCDSGLSVKLMIADVISFTLSPFKS